MTLYPLKFTPISKYRMWGGNKLNTVLNKGFQQENAGESWEISDVEGDLSMVSEGFLMGKSIKELMQTYKGAFLGQSVYEVFGETFPLLIKFIDAKTPLSIQVHPHDEIAKNRHNSFGKNEMWYIMDADENAEIIVGFKKSLSKESYSHVLAENQILEVLNKVNTQKGDAFNIPTGRVHAIGAGVLLAEIQQTSDITYRIFDYNRVDQSTGKERELQNDFAIDVIDFEVFDNYKTQYNRNENTSNQLIHTPYFKSNIIILTTSVEKNYTAIDSFIIYICTSGNLKIQADDKKYCLKKGETMLLPASLKIVTLNPAPEAEILEVYF